MPKIYSYLEVDGVALVPPVAKPPQTDAMVYLMKIDERHYVSVKGDMPKQPAEIKLVGPIDLKSKENRDLWEMLRKRSEPKRRSAFERGTVYPSISDQVGAIMKEFQRRKDKGETLDPELDALLDKVLEVKKKFPDDDLGLE